MQFNITNSTLTKDVYIIVLLLNSFFDYVNYDLVDADIVR
jgi:hypothetical protein